MPKVGNKHFAYTKKGKADAAKARKKRIRIYNDGMDKLMK